MEEVINLLNDAADSLEAGIKFLGQNQAAIDEDYALIDKLRDKAADLEGKVVYQP